MNQRFVMAVFVAIFVVKVSCSTQNNVTSSNPNEEILVNLPTETPKQVEPVNHNLTVDTSLLTGVTCSTVLEQTSYNSDQVLEIENEKKQSWSDLKELADIADDPLQLIGSNWYQNSFDSASSKYESNTDLHNQIAALRLDDKKLAKQTKMLNEISVLMEKKPDCFEKE